MRRARTIALSILGFATQGAIAGEQGFYFGLNAGQAKYDFAHEAPVVVPLALPSAGWSSASDPVARITPVLNPYVGIPPYNSFVAVAVAPVNAYWIPRGDDADTAWGGFVGYRIFRYAAVEATFVHLGTLNETQPPLMTPLVAIPNVESKLETFGPAASILAVLPLNERWELYLRGGMMWADQKVTHSSSGVSSGSSTYGSDALLFGAGAQFDFAKRWTVRLDFQRFNDVGEEHGIGEADIDVWALGAMFRL